MIDVSILVPHGTFSAVNVIGAHEIFEAANALALERSNRPLFRTFLVGPLGNHASDTKLLNLKLHRTIGDVKSSDLVIVPAVHGDMAQILAENGEVIDWIGTQYKNGASVASLCIGAYLMAQAGILDHRMCSLHWKHARKFSAMYPKVKVVPEKIVVEDGGVYSSGGAYAFTNLITYLVEKYGDREIAIELAKTFVIDRSQKDQSPFMIFSGQKNHEDKLVLEVQEFIESNYVGKVTIADLTERFAISRRTLERRFKRNTGNSVVEYIQRVRMESAKKQLETGRKSINEVMYGVGYNDPKSFRDVFKRYVGLSPMTYKERYSPIC